MELTITLSDEQLALLAAALPCKCNHEITETEAVELTPVIEDEEVDGDKLYPSEE